MHRLLQLCFARIKFRFESRWKDWKVELQRYPSRYFKMLSFILNDLNEKVSALYNKNASLRSWTWPYIKSKQLDIETYEVPKVRYWYAKPIGLAHNADSNIYWDNYQIWRRSSRALRMLRWCYIYFEIYSKSIKR